MKAWSFYDGWTIWGRGKADVSMIKKVGSLMHWNDIHSQLPISPLGEGRLLMLLLLLTGSGNSS